MVELFEARHPRDKAVITEVDGTIHHGPIVKGMRRAIVETDEGTRHEYSVPRSVHVNVQESERVRAGDPLNQSNGPIDPHDVLSVLGIKELQRSDAAVGPRHASGRHRFPGRRAVRMR